MHLQVVRQELTQQEQVLKQQEQRPLVQLQELVQRALELQVPLQREPELLVQQVPPLHLLNQ